MRVNRWRASQSEIVKKLFSVTRVAMLLIRGVMEGAIFMVLLVLALYRRGLQQVVVVIGLA